MRIVSSRSNEEIAARQSLETVKSNLRKLAGNMLRVIRGTGKPEELAFQVFKLAESLANYAETFGRQVDDVDIVEALDFWPNADVTSRWSKENRVYGDAERLIIRGALQIAASSLLKQGTQRSAGSSEMHAGIRYIEDYRKNELAEMSDAEMGAKAAGKPSGRKKTATNRRRGSQLGDDKPSES